MGHQKTQPLLRRSPDSWDGGYDMGIIGNIWDIWAPKKQVKKPQEDSLSFSFQFFSSLFFLNPNGLCFAPSCLLVFPTQIWAKGGTLHCSTILSWGSNTSEPASNGSHCPNLFLAAAACNHKVPIRLTMTASSRSKTVPFGEEPTINKRRMNSNKMQHRKLPEA